MSILAIHAHGIPQVQGNHRIGRRGLRAQIYDANPQLPAWREKVTWLAKAERVRRKLPTFAGAVELEIRFWLPRPLSAPRTIDVWPVTRGGGDWDKLARAVGDSLVDAQAISDDSQIVIAHVIKRYVVTRELPKIYIPGFHWEKPGAEITLHEVSTGGPA